MNKPDRLVGLVLLLICLGIPPAWADPAIRLPDGEESAAWAGALRLAGLTSGGEDAPVRIEAVGDVWRIVAVGRDGKERRLIVDEPANEADRESVAFLARGLLREILRPMRTLHAPTRSGVPTDTAPGEADDRPAPPTKGMTGRPLPGAPRRVIDVDGLERSGTSDAAPTSLLLDPEIEVPASRGASGGKPDHCGPSSGSEAELPDCHVSAVPAGRVASGGKPRSDVRSGLRGVPPLWLRLGGASRAGLDGAQLMVGTELLRRGRLRFNVEVGGAVGRVGGLDVPWQLSRLDLEGSATVAVLGPASIGGGFGGSYRTYRREGVLVDRRLVPTAQLRVDVPVYRGRRVALVANLQGRLDLARTELALPDGSTSRRSGFEIQPALILRYHGALDLLSGYRSRGDAKRRATP